MYLKSLDTAIAAHLREAHKTQAEFAKEMGMSDVTFSRKRRGTNGKEFTLGEVARVAKAVGLTSLDGVMADIEREIVEVA